MFDPIFTRGELGQVCRAADMLTFIVRPIGHQLDADVNGNVAGVGDVDVGLFAGIRIEVFLYLTSHLSRCEGVDDWCCLGAQPGDGAADGHAQEEHYRENHHRQPSPALMGFADEPCGFHFFFTHCHSSFLSSLLLF